MADEVIDLDELRSKRLETVKSRKVRFGGRLWELVPELPFEVGELHRRGFRRACVALLLADPGPKGAKDTSTPEERVGRLVDEFMALHPSERDVAALTRALTGMGLGE